MTLFTISGGALAGAMTRTFSADPVSSIAYSLGYNAVWHRTALEIANQPFLAWDFHKQACDHGMSYSNFRRHVRAVIGMAPHDYLLSCRARQAARELQTRGISIKQLAYERGFSDPASLSRLIKNKLGITPRVLIGRHK